MHDPVCLESYIYIKRYFPIWKMTLMICNQLSVGNFNRLSLWCASISLLLPLPLILSSNASVATVFFLQISYVHTALLTWKSCQNLVVLIIQWIMAQYILSLLIVVGGIERNVISYNIWVIPFIQLHLYVSIYLHWWLFLRQKALYLTHHRQNFRLKIFTLPKVILYHICWECIN